ncbi:hypothetical protein AURDEDRAFT_132082 [Auricularia subglabra TFB-10046 SS5]|uniref:Uncharacterized protein n=1 Tax=Auricularia subglabra (strain TFB-10046 / SS5) TaxID=717982 RepID=J0WJY5_AURST|nr:hypothetical protein AURDEDRAFT_132082 [Auricularia subglabra TFB-10046 SS5]
MFTDRRPELCALLALDAIRGLHEGRSSRKHEVKSAGKTRLRTGRYYANPFIAFRSQLQHAITKHLDDLLPVYPVLRHAGAISQLASAVWRVVRDDENVMSMVTAASDRHKSLKAGLESPKRRRRSMMSYWTRNSACYLFLKLQTVIASALSLHSIPYVA